MMTVSANEFSLFVTRSSLADGPQHVSLQADAAQRAALVGRFRLSALDCLRVEAEVTDLGKDGVRVAGRLVAQVAQPCVVTAELVSQAIDEAFAVRLVPEERLAAEGEDGWVDPEGEDVEPLAGDAIDIGELAAQTLALALDPYPRSPGAALPEEVAASGSAESRANPFTVLKSLKDDS